MEAQQIYHNQYMDVLGQINTENALAEQIRQHNQSIALEREKLEEEKRQYNESMAFSKQQYADAKASSSSSSGSSSSSKSSSSSSSKKTSSSGSGSNKTVEKKQTDADKYGTFSNGYQPKGIGDYGAVSKTGDKVVVNGKTQNLWKTSDGTLWYWDGTSRTYKKTTKPKSSSSSSSKKSGGAGLGVTSIFFNNTK